MTKADHLLEAATRDLDQFITSVLEDHQPEHRLDRSRDLITAIAAYVIQAHIQANP